MGKFLWNPRGMSFDFVVPDMKASTGIQKIAGFSRGWHHWNSVRLGINRSENKDFCRLFAYVYLKGERLENHIGDFFVGEKLNAKLIFTDRSIAVMVKRPTEPAYYHQGSFYRPHSFTLPIGYKLSNFAEIDHTNNQIPFKCEINNVRWW